MSAKRAFISFDFDHDDDLRNALVGQAKHPNSPFEIVDMSVRAHLSGNWKEKVRSRIRSTDLVISICGEHTHKAEGVGVEVRLAQEEGSPYFLLHGRKGRVCTKPLTALPDDEMYEWTWDNLRKLIEGQSFTESVMEWLGEAWPLLAVTGLALWTLRQNSRRSVIQPLQSRESPLPGTWISHPSSSRARPYNSWF